jgi:peptidoglycan/LPS O-acetylase OafA/YrhL
MKKSVIVFIIAALVLITTFIWIFSGSGPVKPKELVNIAVIVIVVLFALFFGYKRISSSRKGEPPEDELSKRVMQKASSLSYYISLYLWLAIMYFSEELNYETHTIIGAGILGMALVNAVCWLVFNFRGIRNE